MTDLGPRWQALRKLAGLDDVRVHDCRHTLASHAVMSGLDLSPLDGFGFTDSRFDRPKTCPQASVR